MKKFISILLCALMVMSLLATVFAAPVPSGGTEVMSPHAVTDNHIWAVYNARCNGYTQTWNYKCTHSGCTATKTDTVPCPAAGHSGACNWLPA